MLDRITLRIQQHAAGLRLRLAQLMPPLARLGATPSPCANCGASKAFLMPVRATPDFESFVLPPSAQETFLQKVNGICEKCGLYQDYLRPSDDIIQLINRTGKDALSTEHRLKDESLLHSMAVEFNDLYFHKRVARWREYFAKCGIERRDRVLFLRYWFGAAPAFAAQQFDPREMIGVDISAGCQNYTSKAVPNLRIADGQINGLLSGDFLKQPKYDAIFVFHLLGHAVRPREYLDTLAAALAPGGFIVFSHEIERKVTNPFHFNHFSEWQLVALLREKFRRVDRIDDCQDGAYPATTPFTREGDVPDFVCWN